MTADEADRIKPVAVIAQSLHYRKVRAAWTGGRVTIADVIATGAVVFSAASLGAQGSITGIVYDSLTAHAPIASATVVVVELNRYATTDAHGRFRIDSLPAGRYTLGFTDEAFDALDVALPTVPVDVVAGRRSAVTLASPSVTTVYARLCPGPRAPDTGVILGRVRDVDDHAPLAEATISTDWTEITLAGGRPSSDRYRAAAQTDKGGTYLLCGVPMRVPLDVSGELAGFVAGPTSLTVDSSVIRRVDFAISRRDSAARGVSADDHLESRSNVRGSASLRGVILGGDGRPLRDAVVGVVGAPDSARTDAAGAFHIEGIPAGTRSVQARSIGLLPMTVSMDFATNGARDTTLSMTRKAQELSAVTVVGQGHAAPWMELSGFETRRHQGMGAYVTEEDIARHNYLEFIDVLRTVRGMDVEYLGKYVKLPMPFLLGVATANGIHCVPNFFLDGAPYPVGNADDFANFSLLVRPNLIRGIEVYDTSDIIPPQFDLTSSTGCGSIVVWTH